MPCMKQFKPRATTISGLILRILVEDLSLETRSIEVWDIPPTVIIGHAIPDWKLSYRREKSSELVWELYLEIILGRRFRMALDHTQSELLALTQSIDDYTNISAIVVAYSHSQTLAL